MFPNDVSEIVARARDRQAEKAKQQATQAFEKSLFKSLKSSFAQMIGAALKIVKGHTYDVKVQNQIQLPETQKVEGTVSVAEAKAIVFGLGQVITQLRSVVTAVEQTSTKLGKELKPEKTDLKPVTDAVKAIKIPEVKIPEPLKSVSVDNLGPLEAAIKSLAQKFKIEPPVVNVPAFPKSVSVANLEAVEETLDAIRSKIEESEQKPIGFAWEKDKSGKITSFTEIYENGTVVSEGWNLGRVKIKDDRNTSGS